MSEQKIEMGKQYRTRDGRAVRVLCLDAVGHPCPVVALVAAKVSGAEMPMIFTAYGKVDPGKEAPADLIEVKPRIKRKVWLNVYEDMVLSARYYTSRADADAGATISRIACVEADIDVEEGHGL